MNRQKENELIKETINFLTNGKFKERSPYIKTLASGATINLNGFAFGKELYCWIIWKPTDEEKEPQYKGEPLYKCVPFNVPIKNIPIVLDAQPWKYI